MTHYPYVLSLSRLEMDAYVGFYEAERNIRQPIEISFRLYFAEAIPSNYDDHAPFYDYAKLSAQLRDFAASRKFNLIEYMAMAMFRHMREAVDAMGGTDVKLWLQLNKIKAPVEGLKDGASFIHSDLPPDATFIPSAQL